VKKKSLHFKSYHKKLLFIYIFL